MNHFIIKAAKPADHFYISEASEHVYFLADGFTDLRKTMRCITPRGIRIKSPRWWSKYLKWTGGHLELRHPLLQTMMFEIKPLETKLKATQVIDYEPKYSHEYRHLIKVASVENWPS